ncbi:MAG: GNAT family N-acetyltransferase [Deltaproteobacteria bacterium]|nr:GNAT family N-acetyltransferase [Deltaproteobacteria bacterium]
MNAMGDVVANISGQRMRRVIFEDAARGLTITEWNPLQQDHVDLIPRILWGSDGPRYRIPHMDTRCLLGPSKNILRLERHGKLIGSYLFVGKRTTVAGIPVQAWYRTLLAIDPSERGKGYGQLLVAEAQRHFFETATLPTVLFGYVQSNNTLSMRALEASGYEQVGQLAILAMTRLFPHVDERVRATRPSEREAMVRSLSDRFSDHDLVDVDQSFEPEQHLVLEDTQGIKAGASFARFHEQLVEMPGVLERWMVRNGRRFPVIGRILDFDDYDFLWFSTLHYPEGDVRSLYKVLETAMAREKIYHGMIYLDTRSPMYREVSRTGRGLVAAMSDIYTAEVMVATHDLDLELLRQERPLWISPMVPF